MSNFDVYTVTTYRAVCHVCGRHAAAAGYNPIEAIELAEEEGWESITDARFAPSLRFFCSAECLEKYEAAEADASARR